MSKRLLMLLALVLSLGLIAAGCGDDDSDEGSDEAPAPSTENQDGDVAGTDFGAAELRATLTAGLQEHVYLAGVAFTTAAATGFESDETGLAVEALDKNSVALSEAIGSVYGDDAADTFLTAWRDHIGNFVAYAQAKAEGDNKGAKKAVQDLDGYRAAFGEFFAGANPDSGLTGDAVADELVPHVETVLELIDSVLAGDADVFEKLRAAAGEMPGTAEVLSTTIKGQFPDMFSGDADSSAAELRATLTAGLQEHVYLAGIAVVQGVSNGLDSDQFAAAAKSLDNNSKALAVAIESVYGTDAGKAFYDQWAQHINDFVLYTEGKATGDNKKVKTAEENLEGYKAAFGEFLAGANPDTGLTADAVADELGPHVQTLFDTIDIVTSGDGDPFEALRVAAGEMPGTAMVLSNVIATQFPDMFSSTAG